MSWPDVCIPKSEGGLGLRRLTAWNATLCLRYIWLLFSSTTSLWASWHRFHHLQQSSFWEIQVSDSDSWVWKSLLKLRPLAERFITTEVGNGLQTHFWYDCWTPLGPIIKLLGDSGPRALRLPLNSLVADACSIDSWNLPATRSDNEVTLHAYLTTRTPPSLSSVPDIRFWLINGVKLKQCSASQT